MLEFWEQSAYFQSVQGSRHLADENYFNKYPLIFQVAKAVKLPSMAHGWL